MKSRIWLGMVFLLGGTALPAGAFQFDLCPDYSWTVATYTKRGMPPIDRVWTVDDYNTMQSVMEKLTWQNRLHIPRHKSFHSGPVFARMFSDENLKPITDTSIPLADRKALASGLFGAIQKLIRFYSKPTSQGFRFDEDLVEILAFRLKIVRDLLRLSEEEMAAWPKDDPKRAENVDRIMKSRSTLGRIAILTVRELRPGKKMRSATKLTLTRYFDEILPDIMKRLPDKSAKDLRERIGKLAASYPRDEHGKVLAELAKKLQ